MIHSSAIIFRTQREEGFRAGIFLNLITTPDTKSWICIVGSLYSKCTERSSGHTCYTRDSASAHCLTLVLWDISKTIRVSPLSRLKSVGCTDAVAVPPLSPAQPIVIRNPQEQVSAVCSPHFSDHDNPSAKSKKHPWTPAARYFIFCKFIGMKLGATFSFSIQWTPVIIAFNFSLTWPRAGIIALSI